MPRVAVLLLAVALLPVVPAHAASTDRQIRYKQWATDAQLAQGAAAGVAVSEGRLVLTTGDKGRWTSPLAKTGFGLTELVPSWTAATPEGSWIKVRVRGVTAAGTNTGWDTISKWASGDATVRRTSLGSQPDGGASVRYDTWVAPGGVKRWQLRVVLVRKPGVASPSVDTIGAVASRNAPGARATSTPLGVGLGITLPVPEYSQMTHKGTYSQYNGGGEAWCSPTATSMVLGYYGRLPAAGDYAWVKPGYQDPFVAHAARMTYDYAYGGTGNWPFNTAYAAGLTGSAFVTRLRDLGEAERFIAAGIPVIASISFGKGQLTGAPISATNGHLVVISGFTSTGDVVVNDPAATKDIQRTYGRAQFEAAWLRKSGGLSYVISDASHPLPARDGSRAW